ncbi:MAG: formylglycine-generating enzyme family protein [bacterium]|nr:formylglycine-generating enzyme family protein [bacterium]
MFRSKSTLPALALALASGAIAQNTGTSFCNVTNNSTGMPTTLTGSSGSGVGSDLHLEVTQGVPGELAYFLAGNEATSGVTVSNGVLCLVGTGTAQMFRYNIAAGLWDSVGHFDSLGVFQNLAGTSSTGSGFDVPDTIPSSPPIMIMSGATWHFQVWHRDTPSAQGASNFSNGLSVTFPLAPVVPIAGMVSIPAGSFDMGSNAASGAPYYGSSATQPVHNVTISQDFWMGEHEVTQAEYQALMGSNPSYFSGPNLPVEAVDWNDARAYCTALTAQEMAAGNLATGYEYRLPTEAEWEYACRAGTTTEFNVGSDLFCADARFWSSYHSNSGCGVSNSAGTIDVGSYSANAFGLYDMHGNVWEWCLDSYAGYGAAAVTDPFVTGGSHRVIRGGSWYGNSRYCRSAYRGSYRPVKPSHTLGFRAVLAPVLVP